MDENNQVKAVETNQFNEAIKESQKSLKNKLKQTSEELEKTLVAFESKKKVIQELETTIAKSNIDFVMNLLDIYKGINEIKQEIKLNESLLNRDNTGEVAPQSPFSIIMSKMELVLLYLFPSEEKYNETRELFVQEFGRASVHTEPSEKEIEEFKKFNEEKSDEESNKKVKPKKIKTQVVKFKR